MGVTLTQATASSVVSIGMTWPYVPVAEYFVSLVFAEGLEGATASTSVSGARVACLNATAQVSDADFPLILRAVGASDAIRSTSSYAGFGAQLQQK